MEGGYPSPHDVSPVAGIHNMSNREDVTTTPEPQPEPEPAPGPSGETVFNEIFGVSETVVGTSDNDVFVIDANTSDVSEFRSTGDGQGVEIVYTGATANGGTEVEIDTLIGFEQIRFNDETFAVSDLPLA